MKTESQSIAEGFSSGSLIPIFEALTAEFPEHGIQHNPVVPPVNFASFHIGRFIAHFPAQWPLVDGYYGYVDNYLERDNPKSPLKFKETLTKPIFVENMLCLEDEDKAIYAEIVLLDEKEIDITSFWSGFFYGMKVSERRRIGAKIKELREEKGWTQDHLANLTGLKQPNIARIEKGKYSTTQDILSLIANALGAKLNITS